MRKCLNYKNILLCLDMQQVFKLSDSKNFFQLQDYFVKISH